MAESSLCVFRYTCGRCGKIYTELAIGHSYGTMTARSTGTGQLVVIDALTDPVFDEISALAEEVITEIELAPTAQARGAAIQRAFAASCDPAHDGTPFIIGGHPRCPGCGGASPAEWEHTGDHVTRPVPGPSHGRWDSLPAERRRAIVRSDVIDFLSQ